MLTTMRADNVRIAAMVGLGSYLLYKLWCAASPAPSPTPQQLPYTYPTDSDTNRNGELLSRSILWLKKELPLAFPSATFTAPLSPGTPFGGFGCKLHGIDLSANNGRLTESQAAFLVEALPRFRVLTIADQNVGDAAVATQHSNLSSELEGFTLQHFERFASHFGALVPHPNNLLRGGKQAQGDTSTDAAVTITPYGQRPAAKVDAWFSKEAGIQCLRHTSPAVLTVANIGYVPANVLRVPAYIARARVPTCIII